MFFICDISRNLKLLFCFIASVSWALVVFPNHVDLILSFTKPTRGDKAIDSVTSGIRDLLLGLALVHIDCPGFDVFYVWPMRSRCGRYGMLIWPPVGLTYRHHVPNGSCSNSTDNPLDTQALVYRTHCWHSLEKLPLSTLSH